MSICKMSKIELAFSRNLEEEVLKTIEESAFIHIDKISSEETQEYNFIEKKPDYRFAKLEQNLNRAKYILQVYNTYLPIKEGLIYSFFKSPKFLKKEKFHSLKTAFALEDMYNDIKEHKDRFDDNIKRISQIEKILSELEPWLSLENKLSEVFLERDDFSVILCSTKQENLDRLIKETRTLSIDIEIATISSKEKEKYFSIIVKKQEFHELHSIIKELNIETYSFELVNLTPHQYREELSLEARELKKANNETLVYFQSIAKKTRESVQALYDEYYFLINMEKKRTGFFYSKSLVYLKGWIKTEDIERARGIFKEKDIFIYFSEPTKEEQPPVLLKNNKLFSPFEFLVKLYGFPEYRGVDPTPLVAIGMSLFYGIALGDGGYGFLQVLMMMLIGHFYDPDSNVRRFLNVFKLMGYSTIIIGILTWTWFGYSISTPFFQRFAIWINSLFGITSSGGIVKILGLLPFINPGVEVMPAIIVSLIIGLGFQFISIFMGFIKNLKLGDWQSAIFDNLSWLVFLSSMLIVIAHKLTKFSETAYTITFPFFIVSALLILIFAGRNEKSVFARIIIGIISFYGIIGYYGTVGFMSDILSYMRITVLNITSGSLGYVINVLGGILLKIPIAGIAIFVFFFAFFHIFNLILSMLGAFVHSVRLNYLESFSRYYEVGQHQFTPFKREMIYYRLEK